MVVSLLFFFFKQKTAYELRISDWSSDVCSSDLWSSAPTCRIHHPHGRSTRPGRLIAPPSVLPSPSALRPEQAGRWSSEPDPAEAVLKPEGWRYLVQAVAGLRWERNHGRSAAGPWSGPGG